MISASFVLFFANAKEMIVNEDASVNSYREHKGHAHVQPTGRW